MGDFFQQSDGDPVIETSLRTKGLCRFRTEVFWPRGKLRIIACKSDGLAGPVGEFDLICKGDRNHERLQRMETIRALPQNTERNVDLGVCRECDGISHWIQNTLIV